MPVGPKVTESSTNCVQFSNDVSFQISGVRADYVGNLCTDLSNEMRFELMDVDDRAEHYAEVALKQYDAKLLKGWEIAQYIPDRELWWTRKNNDRYLTDQTTRIKPLPETAKGEYGDDQALMSMTTPPADRTADYEDDDEQVIYPSPVKRGDFVTIPEDSDENEQAKSRKSAGMYTSRVQFVYKLKKYIVSGTSTMKQSDYDHLEKAAANARRMTRSLFPAVPVDDSSNESSGNSNAPDDELNRAIIEPPLIIDEPQPGPSGMQSQRTSKGGKKSPTKKSTQAKGGAHDKEGQSEEGGAQDEHERDTAESGKDKDDNNEQTGRDNSSNNSSNGEASGNGSDGNSDGEDDHEDDDDQDKDYEEEESPDDTDEEDDESEEEEDSGTIDGEQDEQNEDESTVVQDDIVVHPAPSASGFSSVTGVVEGGAASKLKTMVT